MPDIKLDKSVFGFTSKLFDAAKSLTCGATIKDRRFRYVFFHDKKLTKHHLSNAISFSVKYSAVDIAAVVVRIIRESTS